MDRRFKLLTATIVGIILVAAFTSNGVAGEFYKGKTLRFVVGFSAGGGFDGYSRTVSRHIGKHIPGNPSTIVENRPGAGSLIAANYMYAKAKPDGLTIGHWVGGLALSSYLGKKGVKFVAHKFEWVGTPVRASAACAFTKASGITNLDQWLAAKKPVKLGGTAPGALTDALPRLLSMALGVPVKVVTGYKGTAKIRLAAESGEVDGGCWTWESIKSTWRKSLDSGEVNVVVQALEKKHPELPNVANAIDYVKTDEARQLLKVAVHGPTNVLYFYSLPPGTPKDRVKILRTAFMKTMKDPEFLADAKKSNKDINPLSGERVAEIVAGFSRLPPNLIEKLKKIFVPKR